MTGLLLLALALVAGIGLIAAAAVPALWQSTGPVPERDDELLAAVLREHRVTDGPNARP